GHTEATELLIKAGSDIKARSNGGFTALLFAVRAGRLGATGKLLAAGADPNDVLLVSAPAQRPTPSAGAPSRAGAEESPITGGPPNVSGGQRAAPGARPAGTPVETAEVSLIGIRGGAGANGTGALVMAVMNGHFELAAFLLDHG